MGFGFVTPHLLLTQNLLEFWGSGKVAYSLSNFRYHLAGHNLTRVLKGEFEPVSVWCCFVNTLRILEALLPFQSSTGCWIILYNCVWLREAQRLKNSVG